MRLCHFFKLLDSKNGWEHEAVAFVHTPRQQKWTGTRDCCIFSHSWKARTSGNTRRLLHFLTLLDSRIEREHEIVAFVHISGQQKKRAGTRDFRILLHCQTAKTSGIARLWHFFIPLDNKNKREHKTVAFLSLLDCQNEREHETVAFFKLLDSKKRAGTRDCCIF